MTQARAFINPTLRNYQALKSELALSGYSIGKFDSVNPHIYNSVVRSGELVVLGDASTPACTREEAYLMAKAAAVHAELLRSGEGFDAFFLNNFELLKNLLGHASLGAGVVSDGWSRHLDTIKRTLQEIQHLHDAHLSSGTFRARDEFYSKRAALFRQLDSQLGRLAAFGSGLRNGGSIKRTLGLSTKRFLSKGEIAGYADKVAGVSRAASLIKRGTYIGVALEVASAGLSIRQACLEGREEACRRARIVEGSALVGSLSLGSALAKVGALAGTTICAVVLGIPSGGTGGLACAVMGGAVGGMVGGEAGGSAGASIGELIYERTNM
ncbi:hypothetical protein [Pseudomonas cremoricolorata]|uniref:SSU ribosomal protein S2p (SAe) n=1 Tax=Pseudomonas cremoricolorata TaxID=157783 RepID=A0A089WQM4_9PSED|nr:hypothetical protein [Pseudomonas cremoricolorata]AIR89464.1 SSU ribosomal protein S2p (SAe) [Pseudomonas cremoricolorata]